MQLQTQEMKQSKGLFHANFTYNVFEVQTELQANLSPRRWSQYLPAYFMGIWCV